VELPVLPPRGGKGKFTINITEPVTLVPFCKTTPYVIRTNPRNDLNNSYYIATDIIIYFNAALSGETAFDFEEGVITIESKPINDPDTSYKNINVCYNTPVYENKAEDYIITIVPKTGAEAPLADHLIRVTVGPNILNIRNEKMDEAHIFYFKTKELGDLSGSIYTLTAKYDNYDKDRKYNDIFTVTVEKTAGGTAEAYYRVNKGVNIPLAVSSASAISWTIPGIGKLNDNQVRQGIDVSGIHEYEFFIELFMEGIRVDYQTIKIWNIPDMSVDMNNTVHLTQTNFAAALSNTNYTNYVLTGDITLDNWNPVDLSGKNFYGNGYTVTINSMMTSANCGLFGIVNGGLVRDLTVHYNNVAINLGDKVQHERGVLPRYDAQFGGIAGTASGTAQFINVLVKGTTTVTSSAIINNYDYANVGGIAGYMTNQANVNTARGGLNLTINISGKGDVNIGGITGLYYGGTAYTSIQEFQPTLSKCTVTGNITATCGGTMVNIGGIIGYLWGTDTNTNTRVSLDDCVYEQGKINVTANDDTFLGGVIGYVDNYGAFTKCYSHAAEIKVKIDGSSILVFGGFIGYFYTSEIRDCGNSSHINIDTKSTTTGDVYMGGFAGFIPRHSSYMTKLENCWSRGEVRSFGNGRLYTGGLVGYSQGYESVIYMIQQCWATGIVIAEREGDDNKDFFTGGLVGRAEYTQITTSWASGSVTARKTTNIGGGSVGGLVGGATGGKITNCYALSNVLADKSTAGSSSYWIAAGGIAGHATECDVQSNFTAGAVSVQDSGNSTVYAGGIVGRYPSSGSVQNNAALGASVTAKGAGGLYTGRVFGYSPSTSISNNYALDTMRIEKSNSYNTLSFTTQWD